MRLKQRLKRGTGNIKFMADFFHCYLLGEMLIHIDKYFRQQIILGSLIIGQQRFMISCLIELHETRALLADSTASACGYSMSALGFRSEASREFRCISLVQ